MIGSVALVVGVAGIASAQSMEVMNHLETARGDPGTITVPHSSVVNPGDAGVRARSHLQIVRSSPALSLTRAVSPNPAGPPYPGYNAETPASLACVYNLVASADGCNPYTVTATINGGSRAIVLVDAYHYPSALADLNFFSAQFGLPALANAASGCDSGTFQQVCASGQSCSTIDPTGWNIEAALDIQWAHAMAPKAKIFLVESDNNSLTNLMGAVDTANTLLAGCKGGEVSMSWGTAEFAAEDSAYASHFKTANVVYFASTGDSYGTQFPSVLQQVVSVGGTTLRRNPATFATIEEVAWSDGGGGISSFVVRPAYQNSIKGLVGTMRGVPDLAAIADPRSPSWVYQSGASGWYLVGGTSRASPVMAGITNLAGKFKASTAVELTSVYRTPSNFNDISLGYCGKFVGTAASSGWDICTGLGTPKNKKGL